MLGEVNPGALISAIVVCLLSPTSAGAQANERAAFFGVAAGISTLSADARSENTPAGIDVSLYKPENGPAVNVLVGRHLHDFISVQANYIWNRNHVELTSVHAGAFTPSFFDQRGTASQHSFVGDLLVYFRERSSSVRPYLSGGLGVVRLQANVGGEEPITNATPVPKRLRGTQVLLRAAVGIDVALREGWRARYSFSESLSGNPISVQLSPPGLRNLSNFQNLFGIVRAF